MSERDIIRDLTDEFYCDWQGSQIEWCTFLRKVTDRIISDRRATVQKVVGPLKKAHPVAKMFGRYDDLWNAQIESLKLADEVCK